MLEITIRLDIDNVQPTSPERHNHVYLAIQLFIRNSLMSRSDPKCMHDHLINYLLSEFMRSAIQYLAKATLRFILYMIGGFDRALALLTQMQVASLVANPFAPSTRDEVFSYVNINSS